MKIVATSYISNKGIYSNSHQIASVLNEEENWLKSLYSSLEIEYPKFHKMDNISKMAFLGTSVMQEELDAISNKEDEVQLIFANSSSSQTTDLKFIDSFENQGAPSPSLFVYTLPNIVTGELAIRNKWYGENVFFITEKFDFELFEKQIQFAFHRGNKNCLCCWAESNSNQIEECFVFLVSNQQTNQQNFKSELKNLLNQYRNE